MLRPEMRIACRRRLLAVLELGLDSNDGEIYPIQNEDERSSGRLFLVGNVGMPLGTVDTFVGYDLLQPVMFSIPINDVELWVSLDIPRGRVSLDSSKVLGDRNLPIRAYILEVLIAEDKDLPLRGELIESLPHSIGKFARRRSRSRGKGLDG